MSESLSMEWNRRLWGLTMFVFNFGVESLERSVKLDRLVILISLAIPFSKHHFFQTDNQKAVLLQRFRCQSCFSAAVLLLRWRKKTYLKCRPSFCSQIFSVAKCCDIQGSHLIDYVRVDYWPIRMSGLLLSLHWINPLLHWIIWKLHLS